MHVLPFSFAGLTCCLYLLAAVALHVSQKRAHYTVHQPSHRTHLPLFFFALDVAMVRAQPCVSDDVQTL